MSANLSHRQHLIIIWRSCILGSNFVGREVALHQVRIGKCKIQNGRCGSLSVCELEFEMAKPQGNLNWNDRKTSLLNTVQINEHR